METTTWKCDTCGRDVAVRLANCPRCQTVAPGSVAPAQRAAGVASPRIEARTWKCDTCGRDVAVRLANCPRCQSAAAQATISPPQTWKPGDVANGHVLTAEGKWLPVQAQTHDAAALETYRQQALHYRESITGWKPLVFWYGFWMTIFGIGTIAALLSGEVGVFFVGLVITGLLFMYTRYLFGGGTRRVWFFIF